MDSLQMGSTQSLLIVVAVAFSPVIVLFLADAIGWLFRLAGCTIAYVLVRSARPAMSKQPSRPLAKIVSGPPG
jgi:hypothetical protein